MVTILNLQRFWQTSGSMRTKKGSYELRVQLSQQTGRRTINRTHHFRRNDRSTIDVLQANRHDAIRISGAGCTQSGEGASR
jgi:hypothetical protein